MRGAEVDSSKRARDCHCRRLLFSAVFVIFPLVTPQRILAQPQRMVFDKDLTIDDLPVDVEKRIVPGASPLQSKQLLNQQPTLVLNGVTLSITSRRGGSSRSLAVKSIELRGGARIVTNGVNFELDAITISSERGQIASFVENDRPISSESSPGTSGKSGLSAGTVVVNGTLSKGNVLVVTLPGQDGQRGGAGVPGTVGAAGPRGEDAADHMLDCAHGGGNGGNGSQGGQGGTGGNGGAGGDGGLLVLRGGVAAQRSQIEFSALGGKGGVGGSPGPGGRGGPGGQGGSGSTFCKGGRAGDSGADGTLGNPGGAGSDGREGSISAD
jgi:hypothetical protein